MGSYTHDVNHHYDVIWEFDDYHASISGYAFNKALIPKIHYKICTTINECHWWCLKQEGQHHRRAMVFIQWTTELTCPLTLSSRCWFSVKLFCSKCCTSKWDWRLSLRPNLLLQQSMGQGNMSSIDQLTIIWPVSIQI